jgi:acyl-homoserine-lactone acylase
MRKSTVWKPLLLLVLFLIPGGLAYLIAPATPDLSNLVQVGQRYDVHILRDTWGVPHIFGVTDADAAFGLAYAHAEDDFLTIQQTLLAARGQLASVYGKDAAPNDYMVALLRIWDAVNAKYDTDLTPETRAVLEAYADGLNYYAALHPKEILLPEAFPVTGKDVVAGSVHKSPLFFDLDQTLAELFKDTRQKHVSPRPSPFPASFFDSETGSNTFSISPKRTADGSTFLAINSHQPWEGAVTWYEAHVHSQQGWDMVGALFPGSPVIVHGHNRDLGWAFTVNHADLTDVYVLEMNPENANQYRYDGQWQNLEVRQAPIKVRLLGRLAITVNQEVLWSVYGPVVRRPHGVYALRYAGFGRVDIWQQLYRMNKAHNFSEWQAAMRAGGLPTFNVGYADRQGNIYYLYNAMLPMRKEGYDWRQYLPGDTSDTLWTQYLPFDKLPQVLNPPSGFVQNANSTPFHTTLDPYNPNPADYSPTFGIETYMSNRALRALELFGADPSITFSEFQAYKFDWTYSTSSDMARFVQNIREASIPVEDEDLITARQILANWDLSMQPDSPAPTLAVFTLYYLLEAHQPVNASRLVGSSVSPTAVMEAFTRAVGYLKGAYGTVSVPWGQVNRLIRGSADLELGGGPDVLNAIYGKLQPDGRFKGFEGDSYIMLVRWDAQGQVYAYSIHQYGSATLDPTSPHYADQAYLFAQRQLKPVWYDEAEIRAHLESEYRPGEEGSSR